MKQSDAEKVVKQRVAEVFKECKISVNALAKAIGISQTTLNDQINGSSKISAATLLSLADFRPDVSAEWLLRGTGEMTAELSGTEAELRDIIRRQQREIDGLYERIAELKGGSIAASTKIADIA